MSPEQEFVRETLEALAELMRLEGVSRSEMARRLHVRKPTVTNLFSGYDTKLSRVARLADKLGYKAKVVFYGKE